MKKYNILNWSPKISHACVPLSTHIYAGITTVLTMTFLGLEARKDLPKVPYPTALDYFVFISFTYIFTTVVQFGLVHHFTKVVSV
jgi:gamma-aminobutyric acid receptor subunit alpha